jgi:hypothetical protein
VFNHIATTFVDNFVKQADKVYAVKKDAPWVLMTISQ